MPDRPASAAATVHTSRITLSTSIPEAAASAGLSETARVARPIRVRSSAYPTTAIITTEIAIATSDRFDDVTGPNVATVGLSTTTRTVPAPMKYWKVYCIASDKPIVTIIIWVSPSPRRRSGCHINRSWIHPVKPHSDHDQDATQQQTAARLPVDQQ